MKKSLIIIFLVLLLGCAARLNLTDQQKNIVSTISDAEATDIVVKIFTKTDEQSGLFGSNSSPFISNPKILKIENGKVTYADYEEHLSNVKVSPTLISPTSINVATEYEHTIQHYTIDLRKLTKIHIVSSWAFNQDALNSVDGVQLGFKASSGEFVNIDIKKEYLNEAIAVARYYSPKATIKSGSGL